MNSDVAVDSGGSSAAQVSITIMSTSSAACMLQILSITVQSIPQSVQLNWCFTSDLFHSSQHHTHTHTHTHHWLPAGLRAVLPVLFLLRGRFFGFSPPRATRSTDQREIWRGGGQKLYVHLTAKPSKFVNLPI